MNGNAYYVVTEKKDGKFVSYALTVGRNQNIGKDFFGKYDTVNNCSTKKEAEEIARYWNECYKKNGTYMY